MNLNDLSFDELKALAEAIEGFEFDKRWGKPKLKAVLTEYLEVNPDKIPAVTDNQIPLEQGSSLGIPGDTQDNIPPVIPDEEQGNPPPGNGDQGDNTPPDEKSDEKIKIQSIHRGEIASSFGMLDFGTDGIAEVSAEAAEMLCKLKGYEKC